MLEGKVSIGDTITNFLTPPEPALPPPPPVDLAPMVDSLTELKTQHQELRAQIVEQNAALKQIEEHLEMVREATDRNTLEQKELLEDLSGVGHKVNFLAFLALGLLAVSILANTVLYLHILKVLP